MIRLRGKKFLTEMSDEELLTRFRYAVEQGSIIYMDIRAELLKRLEDGWKYRELTK